MEKNMKSKLVSFNELKAKDLEKIEGGVGPTFGFGWIFKHSGMWYVYQQAWREQHRMA